MTLPAIPEIDSCATTPEPASAVVDVSSSPVLAALEATWAAIRARHPDLPAVVVVLASGSEGAPAGWLKLGHYAKLRWTHHENEDQTEGRPYLAEVFVGGEGLARGPVEVLGTLLHEAAHALADVRRIKDTSRAGRYHNARYADLAREVGLDVAQIAPIGWSNTSVTERTAQEFPDVIARLAEAITITRRLEAAVFGLDSDTGDDGPATISGGDTIRRPARPKTPDATSSRNGVPAVCGCARRIRVTASVLALGPIVCGRCDQPFTSPTGDDGDSGTGDGVS